MKTQAEYVAEAVANRSKVIDGINKAVEEAFETLIPLFKEDFKHQRFVRGISREGSIKQLESNLDFYLGDLAERVRNKALLELDDEGLLYGGL